MRLSTKLGRKLVALAASIPGLRELKAADLGQSYEDRYGPMDCAVKASTDYRKEKSYPSFYIDSRTEPLEIGDEGQATIKYRVTSRSINESGGRKRHGYGIEVHSIDPSKEKKGKKGIDIAPEKAKLLESGLEPSMIELRAHGGVSADWHDVRHGGNRHIIATAKNEPGGKNRAKRHAGSLVGAAAGLGVAGALAAKHHKVPGKIKTTLVDAGVLAAGGAVGGHAVDSIRKGRNLKKSASDDVRDAGYDPKKLRGIKRHDFSDLSPGMIELGKGKEKKEEHKARWGAVHGAASGAVSGAGIGVYSGILNKDTHRVFAHHVRETQSAAEHDKFGTHHAAEKPKPFGRGAFDAEERAARGHVIRSGKVKKMFKRRAGKGAVAGAAAGALIGYAGSKSGANKHPREMSGLRPGMIHLASNPRNTNGQFAETDAGTVTPNQIHAAYRTPPLQTKKKGGVMAALRRMASSGTE